jgi:hypothetical protein
MARALRCVIEMLSTPLGNSPAVAHLDTECSMAKQPGNVPHLEPASGRN